MLTILFAAVGSYTENRGLIQGSAQSAGGADGDDGPNKKYWFLNIKRYRRFFNVDTEVSYTYIAPDASQAYALDGMQRWNIIPLFNGLDHVTQQFCVVQDILIRIRDSVIGSYKADFFDKTTDNADL